MVGLFPANTVGDDDIERVRGRVAPRRSARGCITCASKSPNRRTKRSFAWRTSWRPTQSGRADYIGRVRA